MKHVLVLNQFAVPRTVSGGTRHAELFGRLDGWDATILAGKRTLWGERIESGDGFVAIPVTPYRRNGIDRIVNWLSYAVLAFVRGVVSRPRPDVVYGSSPQLGAAAAAWAIAKIRRAPFVLEVRDLWPQILLEAGTLTEDSRLYRLLRRLELALYSGADHIVLLADGSVRALADWGVPEAKMTLIPNGADPADFEVDEPRGDLRRRFGFDRFTVVYAGAHGPANGLEAVLDAAEDLAAERPEIEFVLVGDGVSKPGLVAEARRRELANVRFLDPIPKSEMPALLAAADLGLHVLADVELFKSAVSPNKLFDYMAAGLPVVTNVEGPVGTMVNDSRSGIARRDVRSAIVAIADLPDDERGATGRRGVRYVGDNNSRASMAERLRCLLDSLVRSGSV